MCRYLTLKDCIHVCKVGFNWFNFIGSGTTSMWILIFYIIEKDFGGNTIKVEIATRKMNTNFAGGRGGGGRGGGFGRGEFFVFVNH